MAAKKRNPVSGASRHNRVINIDVPGRKFDNDQHMVFDLSSKAASAAHRHTLASGSRIDGGLCLRYQYVDSQGLPLAPSYRVYKPESFSGFDFEITPSEDAVLYAAPGEHNPAAYDAAHVNNALARTEWRRIIARSHKGLANEVGLRSTSAGHVLGLLDADRE